MALLVPATELTGAILLPEQPAISATRDVAATARRGVRKLDNSGVLLQVIKIAVDDAVLRQAGSHRPAIFVPYFPRTLLGLTEIGQPPTFVLSLLFGFLPLGYASD